MILREIISELEAWAPFAYQEEWDNSGLIIGDPGKEISGILLSLDTKREVLQEALDHHCNLVISHHPLIFKGITSITPRLPEYEMILFAIKNDIAVLALHTNLDNRNESLNHLLGRKIGLDRIRILKPKTGFLKKLVTFCPIAFADQVRKSVFDAGAGHIGEYNNCSFNTPGEGTFRSSEKANPFVGEKNTIHTEEEIRIEVIFPAHLQSTIIKALLNTHPYEEVAYDIFPLDNMYQKVGSGIFGYLSQPMNQVDFINRVKDTFQLESIRYSKSEDKQIHTVAVCSGSGSFLLPDVYQNGIDAFLTGDLKYHDFQGASMDLLLVDIGHYESEQFVKGMLKDLLLEKFPNFAVLISERESNPITYL